MGAIGFKEILFVVVAAAIFFGVKRLPDVARGLGSGIRNFRGSLKAGAESTPAESVDGEVR